MILTRCFLTLLGVIALQNTARANLQANDEQTCIDLCKNCGGVASFEDNGDCQCHVAKDNFGRGAECIGRIKRQAEELGMDIVSCDLADNDADRPARCVLSPTRRFRSGSDAELIAKYFMGNGLGGFSSLLGSSKSEKGEKDPVTGAPNSSSATETGDADIQSTGDKSDTDSANIVGAANPMSAPLLNMNPLLGAAASWLQPNTLLAIRNGMQSVPTAQGYVGQQNLNSMSEMNSMQGNLVGDSHHDTVGHSSSMKTYDSYNAYPTGAIVGMSPYSYYMGASGPVQLQDGSQGQPMQPYLYSYNTMLGAQNPLFAGGNHVGLSPWGNCATTSLVGANNPQLQDPAVSPEASLDESDKLATELLGKPNTAQSFDANKAKDSQNQEDKLGTMKTEDHSEIKDQTVGSSNYGTKRRQSRLRSKDSDSKPETLSISPQEKSADSDTSS